MKLVQCYYCFIGTLVLAGAAVVAGEDANKAPAFSKEQVQKQAVADSIDHVILQRLEGQTIEPGTNLHLHGHLVVDLSGTKDTGLNTTQVYPVEDLEVELNGIRAVSDQQLSELVLFQPTEQAAYMGVGVESPGETLRAQLALPDGTGLVVNYLDDKGPAKNSIQKHDVLQKLDDQILINGEQLVALVRLHKPGEKVSLTLLRKAKQISIEVELGAKQVTDEPKELSLELFNQADRAIDNSRIAVLSEVPHLERLYSNQVEARPMTFNDGEVLASLDGHGNLLAVEVKSGKILFQGPIGTDAQWKQVPDRVREKLAEWRRVIVPGDSAASPSAAPQKDTGHEGPKSE